MMGHRTVILGLGLLLLVGCASAPKRPRSQEAPFRPATALLLPYAAPDGSLTRVQLREGLKRDFDKADANHSGCLDANEIRAINQQRWKNDASSASPLIDFKSNGCFDFEEFAATPLTVFDMLDANGTGKLTAKQLKPGSQSTGQQQDQSNNNTQQQGQGHHRHGGGGGQGGGDQD